MSAAFANAQSARSAPEDFAGPCVERGARVVLAFHTSGTFRNQPARALSYDRSAMRLTWFALMAIVGAITLGASQPDVARRNVPELSTSIDRTTRLLVIAPHPDDEALGAAGLIQRVRARGGSVRVVLLTSGDGFPEGVEVAEGIAHPKASDFRGYGVLREARNT